MESERRSERVKAGMERARAEGKQIGRPPAVDDEERERVREMYEDGLSYTQIENETEISKSTISRILNNDWPLYEVAIDFLITMYYVV